VTTWKENHFMAQYNVVPILFIQWASFLRASTQAEESDALPGVSDWPVTRKLASRMRCLENSLYICVCTCAENRPVCQISKNAFVKCVLTFGLVVQFYLPVKLPYDTFYILTFKGSSFEAIVHVFRSSNRTLQIHCLLLWNDTLIRLC
jgi:hypothetical protein